MTSGDRAKPIRVSSHRMTLRPTVWVIWLIALVVLLPVAMVLMRILEPAPEMWQQVVQYRLSGYLWETVLLVTLVTGLAVLFGVPAAWYVSVHEFKGRGILEWMLLLPLAMPGFIAAIAYVDTFHNLTPLYIWIRDHWGIEAFRTSQQISAWIFASVILASTLFPYVFLSCRAVFLLETASFLEASRMLGAGSLRAFGTVALPLARPAVVAGASLVAMESVNDLGVVSYFGINSLTPGIFRAWSEGFIGIAMRLSLILMVLTLLGLVIERWQRGKRRFSSDTVEIPLARRKLSFWGGCWAWVLCGVPLALGFLIPAARMVYWGSQAWGTLDWGATWAATWNSLSLAAGAALLILIGGLILVAGRRALGGWSLHLAQRIGILGYTFPSALVAVGVGAFVNYVANSGGGKLWMLALHASVFGLLLAYFVRFLAVGVQPMAAGFERVSRSLTEAARTMGTPPLRALMRIELPLVWPSLLAAMTLAFMDVFKELTITQVLRPFDFETLATQTFRLITDEGRMPEASIPGLALVLFSLFGLIPLTHMLRRASRKTRL
jgi:iron(III) transport system permease protein